jgi:hypothetical protein
VSQRARELMSSSLAKMVKNFQLSDYNIYLDLLLPTIGSHIILLLYHLF